MTAKKIGDFSGRPGPRSKAHDKYRLVLAYNDPSTKDGKGLATAIKRACLKHPDGLKPQALVAALKAVPPGVGEATKIKLKQHMSADLRADLEAEVDRLRKLYISNKEIHGDAWFVDLHLSDSVDHDADIEDELGRVMLPRSL